MDFHSRTLNNKINSIHERALRTTYNDRKWYSEQLLRKDNTVFIHYRNLHGTKLLSLLGPNIWELVSEDIEQSESLDVFKSKTKNWVPLRCPCRLFRLYLQDIGFI